MNFLLLNQTFYPDVASTAQHLTDLAVHLAERGHRVTVLTSRRAYDTPTRRFPSSETWRGIRVLRLAATGLGKSARWRRAADFATFLVSCCLRGMMLPRPDVIVALTSPPLISSVGAWLARRHRCRFAYWVMDLNPDEALAAGWLRPDSIAAKLLTKLSRWSLRSASCVIALDRFMRDRLVAQGVDADRITVIPPWSHDDHVWFDAVGRKRFRQEHGLEDRFVVMYSGNHSPCHPLDTLLAAAQRLSGDSRIRFCFVGGGSEFSKIQRIAAGQESNANGPLGPMAYESLPTSNLVCLPYQPLDQLAGSLSAADLHVVVMGEPFVGIVHPCKIYNILRIGVPVLYIGPQPSHVTEILATLNGDARAARVSHGEVERVVQAIQQMASNAGRRAAPSGQEFLKETLLPQLVAALDDPSLHPGDAPVTPARGYD